VIPIFAPAKQLRKTVMQIITDSRSPEEPKNPDECNVYNIFKYFGEAEEVAAMRALYLRGGFGYGEVKQQLYEKLESFFGEKREHYNELINDKKHLETVLLDAADRARHIGSKLMRNVRRAVGVRHKR